MRSAFETMTDKQDRKRVEELYESFNEQLKNATARVCYYDENGHKNEMDRLFEQHYTNYSGKGIIDYMRDILMAFDR